MDNLRSEAISKATPPKRRPPLTSGARSSLLGSRCTDSMASRLSETVPHVNEASLLSAHEAAMTPSPMSRSRMPQTINPLPRPPSTRYVASLERFKDVESLPRSRENTDLSTAQVRCRSLNANAGLARARVKDGPRSGEAPHSGELPEKYYHGNKALDPFARMSESAVSTFRELLHRESVHRATQYPGTHKMSDTSFKYESPIRGQRPDPKTPMDAVSRSNPLWPTTKNESRLPQINLTSSSLVKKHFSASLSGSKACWRHTQTPPAAQIKTVLPPPAVMPPFGGAVLGSLAPRSQLYPSPDSAPEHEGMGTSSSCTDPPLPLNSSRSDSTTTSRSSNLDRPLLKTRKKATTSSTNVPRSGASRTVLRPLDLEKIRFNMASEEAQLAQPPSEDGYVSDDEGDPDDISTPRPALEKMRRSWSHEFPGPTRSVTHHNLGRHGSIEGRPSRRVRLPALTDSFPDPLSGVNFHTVLKELLSLPASESWLISHFSHEEQQQLMFMCNPSEEPEAMAMRERGRRSSGISVAPSGQPKEGMADPDSHLLRVCVRVKDDDKTDQGLLTLKEPCEKFGADSTVYRQIEIPASQNPHETECFTMTFDQVLGPELGQRELFELIAKPYLQDAISKLRHAMIMAYGQSGTGKTYTLEGRQTPKSLLGLSLGVNTGIIGRMMRWIFFEPMPDALKDPLRHCFGDLVDRRKITLGKLFDIKMSYLEIYMENPRDLLSDGEKIKLRETSSGGLFWENLTEIPIQTYEQAIQLCSKAQHVRCTGETMANRTSSRSHVMLTLNFSTSTWCQRPGRSSSISSGASAMRRMSQVPSNFRIDIVDLAGNEKLSKSQASGMSLQELRKINQSLSTLGLVLKTLSKTPLNSSSSPLSTPTTASSSSKKLCFAPQHHSVTLNALTDLKRTGTCSKATNQHIPFRNSLLTRALQHSLSGDNPVILICTVSNQIRDFLETLTTLRFAQQCQNISVIPKHQTGNVSIQSENDVLKVSVLKLLTASLRLEKASTMLLQRMKACKDCRKWLHEASR